MPDVPRLKRIKRDIREHRVIDNVMEGASGIVHLAAISRVKPAEENPDTCHSTNVGGTFAVMSAAAQMPSLAWVIHASSREVYGEPAFIPVDEFAPLRPINVYGRSKLAAETVVRMEAMESGVNAAILRFSNVYGSVYDRPDRVIPIFIRQALANKQIELCNGEKVFDFTHIEDAGRAIESAIMWSMARNGVGEVLTANIATGRRTSLKELASFIVRLSGSRSTIREVKGQSFEVHRFMANTALAWKELGFMANVNRMDGVARTIRLYSRKLEEKELKQ
jgi:dTDP-glucose 4,6-dehydratase/UDP-glucose 4-epimerase